jgi:dipeptidyl aminopeptidase/acylaminoacyl peptidase
MDIVDPTRLFMLGVSRGGTMSYMTLAKRDLPIRAAAVIAGPSDLEALGRYRPKFVNGDDTYWYNHELKIAKPHTKAGVPGASRLIHV